MRRLGAHPAHEDGERRRWLRIATADEGASLVMVAILLVVLIGFAAFAIDIAALYAERRELQSGADAAVLAVAEACGLGEPCDTASAVSYADSYADDNATDSFAGIESLDLDTAAQTVTAVTRTEEPGGSTIFAPVFAQVLGWSGTTVNATASAAWGAPLNLNALPLIISDCEWNKVAGTIQDGPPFAGSPVIFFFHDGNTTDDCAAQAGQDTDGDGRLPGGFGWLETGGDCEATLGEGAWVGEDPGASPSTGCGPAELRNLIFNKTVLIPYFSDVNGLGGANGEYLVTGFGAFYVTGYNFGGQYKAPSPATAPCGGDKRCIAGYVTTETVSDGDIGGEDRGVLVVKLTG